MKFVATIECDNAAFDEFNEGDLHSETGDILYKLANKIKDGHSACYLNDSNGNKVGYAEFIKEEENIVENFIKDLVQESNKKIVDIDCFKVYETDGYTRTKKYYVSSESLAMQLCHGKNYLGYENHKISYKIYDTLEEIKQGEREAKINAIKAKLTPEELELIGL